MSRASGPAADTGGGAWSTGFRFRPSKKYKGTTRKVYVLRPIITARRQEDLAECARRAIKWWGDKGMTAVYLQVEWLPGVRSTNRAFVTDARRWNAKGLKALDAYWVALRCWCEDAIVTTVWQAPPYYWRTRRWDGRLAKEWNKPFTSVGEAFRNHPGGAVLLVQGNRRVTQREIDAVRAAETAAWEAPWRATGRREVGPPFIKGFVTLPKDVAPGLREVVVDGASAPEDGREAETTAWRAPGVSIELEVVEDGAPPSQPGPPEHWHVLEHDHAAVQALALVAQANQWIVRRLPLEHGLDVMFACAPADVAAVRALLVKQDEEDDD